MKRLTAYTCISCALISLGVFGLSYADSQPNVSLAITMVESGEIQWKDGPNSLAKGFQHAILSGNPSEPGLFTMRLKLPANYQVPVHHHLSAENITVISGTVRLVYGDKLDKSKLFKAGSFISIPETVKHFAMTADSEAIVQLNNLGPWEINYLDPKADPRKQ